MTGSGAEGLARLADALRATHGPRLESCRTTWPSRARKRCGDVLQRGRPAPTRTPRVAWSHSRPSCSGPPDDYDRVLAAATSARARRRAAARRARNTAASTRPESLPHPSAPISRCDQCRSDRLKSCSGTSTIGSRHGGRRSRIQLPALFDVPDLIGVRVGICRLRRHDRLILGGGCRAPRRKRTRSSRRPADPGPTRAPAKRRADAWIVPRRSWVPTDCRTNGRSRHDRLSLRQLATGLSSTLPARRNERRRAAADDGPAGTRSWARSRRVLSTLLAAT